MLKATTEPFEDDDSDLLEDYPTLADFIEHDDTASQDPFLLARPGDNLSLNERRFMSRKAARVGKTIRKNYERLGKDRRAVVAVNTGERLMSITFLRVIREGDKYRVVNEAVLLANLEIDKPLTEKLRAKWNLQDSETRDRGWKLILRGNAMHARLNVSADLGEHTLVTGPALGDDLFKILYKNLVIEHPYNRTRFQKLIAGEVLGKASPLPEDLDAEEYDPRAVKSMIGTQGRFAVSAMHDFQRAFREKYGHIFSTADFDIDSAEKTFRMEFEISSSVVGRPNRERPTIAGHAHHFEISGRAKLVWRTDTSEEPSLTLLPREQMLRGVLPELYENAQEYDPMDSFDIVQTDHAVTTLFNTIVAAKKLNASHANMVRLDQARYHEHPRGRHRKHLNRSDRHRENTDVRGLIKRPASRHS